MSPAALPQAVHPAFRGIMDDAWTNIKEGALIEDVLARLARKLPDVAKQSRGSRSLVGAGLQWLLSSPTPKP
eukprot:5859035-Alexandrium_andersonii.AAC.1